MENYPSNSHKLKDQPAKREKKVEKPVVTGHATTKKKSELSKFTEAFITEDAASVKSYILQDVVIPAAKRIIDDVVVGSLRMVLFGERGRNGGGHTNASKVSYRSYYERENGRRDSTPSRMRSGFDYDNITFDNRGDAEAVLSEMETIIESDYKMVSVADLYDLADVSNTNYAANRYGWTNLSSAKIERDRDGRYYIRLPKALPLD